MPYFKLNGKDYSGYVNSLKVGKSVNYNAQTNAAGDTVVDYINSKRTIEVGFIPLDDAAAAAVLAEVDAFGVSVSFRDPRTGVLSEEVGCICPDSEIEYSMILVNRVLYKEFTLKFTEL